MMEEAEPSGGVIEEETPPQVRRCINQCNMLIINKQDNKCMDESILFNQDIF